MQNTCAMTKESVSFHLGSFSLSISSFQISLCVSEVNLCELAKHAP